MIPSSQFLCALKHVPEASETGLKISKDDFHMFKTLKTKLTTVSKAVSDLNKRKRVVQNGSDREPEY